MSRRDDAARFSLSVYDSDYVRIILDALAAGDASALTVRTGDITTHLAGPEPELLQFLCDVIARAAGTGVHVGGHVLLRAREAECAPARTGVRARAHWSVSVRDGTTAPDAAAAAHAAAHVAAAQRDVDVAAEPLATRLDGDLADVLQVVAVGSAVGGVDSHLTLSINSPTPVDRD